MAIRKVQVSRGIWWVEVPEADLRVLCGAPADSVKHLIKRGLILAQEVHGVPCETGPNAILLSDLPLQDGEFANLAEFPVLQMLYRQGMILPDHPNNTGRKPLLIGSAEQVSAQMQYIYRGNYGLVSKEEIMEAGINEAEAEAMMRLKLAFAFGRIKPSGDFLDGLTVSNSPVEIRGGVTIRRLATNLFEFAHDGEIATVDLNLGPGQRYESAFPLGFRTYQDNYFAIIHSGEGDGWDVRRPTMSSIIVYQGKLFLIDAGPNLAHMLTALGIGLNQIDGIFHSHAHDDHFAGLTTLMRAGKKIRYFATPLVRHTVSKKLAALLDMEEERFNDYFDVQDLAFDRWNDIDGLEVKPVFSPHPVETNLFFFRTLWGDGWRSYAHFADIASLAMLEKMVSEDPAVPGLTRAWFETIRADYLMAADVKKIDVGGGMIHGAAADFRDDKTPRLLLAHRAGDLTMEEKEIGSSAAFGTADVLVPAQSEGLRRQAFIYLQAHLPGVPIHHLRALVNHPLEEINPGALMLKEGEEPQYVHLILSGGVEKISTRNKVYGAVSAGFLVGAAAILESRPCSHTYRAISFVQAMLIPAKLFATIVERNGLIERSRQLGEMRHFLENTQLFSQSLPSSVLNRIVDNATLHHFAAGEVITCRELDVLNIIRKGSVERTVGGRRLDILGERDFFGEERAILNTPCLFRLTVVEDVELVQIPGEVLADIPMVRWKFYEGYLHRAAQILHAGGGEGFVWQDAFSIQIAHMDTHHKRLMEIANAIIETLGTGGDLGSLAKAFDALVDYTQYHFAAEEEVMARYAYPGASYHIEHHQRLLAQVVAYNDRILDGTLPTREAFRHFFEGWMIRHILDEDRKYGQFLNSKGVY